MNIFDKRPLSLILCIMLGTFVFFSFYEYVFTRFLSIILIVIAFSLSFFRPIQKRISPILIRVTSACALVAILFSFVYFDLWFKAYDRYDEDVKIVGQIEDFERASHRSALIIKTDNIDDTSFSKYKIIVYLENDKYYGYSIGSKVELIGKIESFTSDENFDAKGYYSSRGISGIVNDVKDFKITDNGEYPLSYKIKDFRESICRRIIINSSEKTGGLLCALLLGEKDYLPLGTKLDFSRTGISHILALSGMHLAILSLGFTKLLLFFKMSKKSAVFFNTIFTVLYMFLTGLSLSVMRAGIMLIISSILFLLGNCKDSMTSLFSAVSIICIFQPYAIFDTSLWLSAFATLGIIVMSEYQSEKYSKPSFIKWIYTSLLSSFFAIAATFVITTLKFDGFSLLAPITTFFFAILVEIFIYLGIFLLIFSPLIPIRYLFVPLGNLILYLIDSISDMGGIYVSSNFAVIKILSVIFSIIFFGFFILNLKYRKLIITSLIGMLTIIYATATILSYKAEAKTAFTYCNSTYEHIFITEDSKLVAIDIASYDRGTAYSLYNDIADKNFTEIDKYVITHYSYYLDEAISTILECVLIREIYLPIPKSATEERILKQVYALSEESGIKFSTYLNEDIIRIGDTAIIPVYNYTLGEQKKNLFTVFHQDNVYTYLNDGILDGETKNMAADIIAGSHTIILGRHKSGNSETVFSKKSDNLKEIIFSDTNAKIDTEVYEYYINNGTKITIGPYKKYLYVE